MKKDVGAITWRKIVRNKNISKEAPIFYMFILARLGLGRSSRHNGILAKM